VTEYCDDAYPMNRYSSKKIKPLYLKTEPTEPVPTVSTVPNVKAHQDIWLGEVANISNRHLKASDSIRSIITENMKSRRAKRTGTR
jgi:hypothetical protein